MPIGPDSKGISKEEFSLWKIHPVTIALFKELRETRAQLEDALSSGETLTGTAGDTAERTARMVGNIEGINMLLETYFEDDEGERHAMPD